MVTSDVNALTAQPPSSAEVSAVVGVRRMLHDCAPEREDLDFNQYLAAMKFGGGSDVGPVDVRQGVVNYRLPSGIGLPWGDLRYFSFRPHEWTIWGGYTHMGKTTHLLHACLHAVALGRRVAVANFEDSPIGTYCAIARIAGALEGQADRLNAVLDLLGGNIRVLDLDRLADPHLSSDEVFTWAWQQAHEWGADLIVVDNLASLAMPADGRGYLTSQTRLASELSRFVKRYRTHVVLVAHGRKPAMSKTGGEPPMGAYDVSGSANLVNLAWNVVQVWRNMRRAFEDAAGEEDAQIIVHKQRATGQVGRARLWRDVITGQLSPNDAPPIDYLGDPWRQR